MIKGIWDLGKGKRTPSRSSGADMLSRTFYVFLLLGLSLGTARGELPNDKMDYTSYAEMVDVLEDLEAAHPDIVTLKSIGHSIDIPFAGQTTDYDIYALRVGPTGDQDLQDGGDGITSILFVGGIHGREWLAAESLVELARELVEKAQNAGSTEYALLRRVAVWIIPMVNAAGRLIDDQHAGDPYRYYTGLDNAQFGWRHSADFRDCESAVDINRNFSTGWGTASPAGCGWDRHFEGLAEFSNQETAALRQFVQNHWVCMAVDVHTCSQLIWNTWGTGDTAGVKMKQRAVEYWRRGLRNLAERIYDPPEPGASLWRRIVHALTVNDFVDRFELDSNDEKGTGGGQFTAWLQEEQHVQSLLLELPPNNKRPQTDYFTSEFRYRGYDSSNAFHPSSSRVGSLIRYSFFPLAKYLIGQADAPGSATMTGTVPDGDSAQAFDTDDPGGSPRRDFGILAAKIGRDDPDAPGELVSLPADLRFHLQAASGFWYVALPAYDWLYPADDYTLYYWVQNYSRSILSRRCTVTLELKSRAWDSDVAVPWTTDQLESRRFSLQKREKVMDRFDFDVAEDREYELSVRVRRDWRRPRSDQFRSNDEKIFKFTTRWMAPEHE